MDTSVHDANALPGSERGAHPVTAPHEFFFLSVALPDAEIDHHITRVTPKGRDADGHLTPHGILQIAILLTLPFTGAADNQVVDVRPRTPKLKRLQTARDRHSLVESLAEALLEYEQSSCSLVEKVQMIHVGAETLLDTMGIMVATFGVLRRAGQLPASLTHLRSRQVLSAYETLTALHRGLMQRDYYRAAWLRGFNAAALQAVLLRRCCDAFVSFGPPRYPRDAVYHALAAILNSLGITNAKGRSLTAAAIQRALHSAST
jgi:hypothetical protein